MDFVSTPHDDFSSSMNYKIIYIFCNKIPNQQKDLHLKPFGDSNTESSWPPQIQKIQLCIKNLHGMWDSSIESSYQDLKMKTRIPSKLERKFLKG